MTGLPEMPTVGEVVTSSERNASAGFTCYWRIRQSRHQRCRKRQTPAPTATQFNAVVSAALPRPSSGIVPSATSQPPSSMRPKAGALSRNRFLNGFFITEPFDRSVCGDSPNDVRQFDLVLPSPSVSTSTFTPSVLIFTSIPGA
jgi:hypothetical protein